MKTNRRNCDKFPVEIKYGKKHKKHCMHLWQREFSHSLDGLETYRFNCLNCGKKLTIRCYPEIRGIDTSSYEIWNGKNNMKGGKPNA